MYFLKDNFLEIKNKITNDPFCIPTWWHTYTKKQYLNNINVQYFGVYPKYNTIGGKKRVSKNVLKILNCI